jgi:hypothetical protein
MSSESEMFAAEFPEHLVRMRSCLSSAGWDVTDGDIVSAWRCYSESLCASWLVPPADNAALTQLLLEFLLRSDCATGQIFHVALNDLDHTPKGGLVRRHSRVKFYEVETRQPTRRHPLSGPLDPNQMTLEFTDPDEQAEQGRETIHNRLGVRPRP